MRYFLGNFNTIGDANIEKTRIKSLKIDDSLLYKCEYIDNLKYDEEYFDLMCHSIYNNYILLLKDGFNLKLCYNDKSNLQKITDEELLDYDKI